MRILIVAERFWPEVGAAPTRLANLACGLIKEGQEVEVVTCLPNYPKGRIFEGYRHRLWKKEEYKGATLFRMWTYASVSKKPLARIAGMFSFALTMWLFAFRIGRIRKYDRVIIQTPTLVSAKSAMRLFHGLYRKKCVLNVSDIWPSTAVDLGAIREGSVSYKYLLGCERYLYKKADAIMGQSQEILSHIAAFEKRPDRLFLYRNLPTLLPEGKEKVRQEPMKLVFSGMLGVAQNVAAIVREVPFEKLSVEFHILGGGAQYDEICAYIESHPGCNVFAHGFVEKEKMPEWLAQYDASIVPLTTRIRGAVPSKIYDILPYGLPIIFCGEGEAASIIQDNRLGLVCPSSDFEALTDRIKTLKDMSMEDFQTLRSNCIAFSHASLNFDKQMKECLSFLNLAN